MTPEQELELETRFLDAVRSQPGITVEALARKMGIPEYGIKAACECAVDEGILFVLGGCYFAAELATSAEESYHAGSSQEDPYFVTDSKPPEFLQPTEPDLDSWEFFYGLVKELHGMTWEQFNALPKQSQDTIQDATQEVEIRLWLDSPDSKGYIRTQENFKTIGAWLNERHVPITRRNLTRAFNAQLKSKEQIKQEYLDQLKRDFDKDKWQN